MVCHGRRGSNVAKALVRSVVQFGISGKGAMRTTGLDWLRDYHDASRDNDEFSEEHGLHRGAGVLCGTGTSHMATVRAPDTPDKPLTDEGLTGPYRRFSVHDHLLEPNHVSSPAISTDIQEKIPPACTIDFTNLPPPTRRWRFPDGPTSRRPDAKDDTGTGPARQCLGEDSEDVLEVNGKSRMSSDNVKGYADSTAEAMKDLVPQTRSL